MPEMIEAAAKFTEVIPEPQNLSKVTPLARWSNPDSADIYPNHPLALNLRGCSPDDVVHFFGR